MNVIGFLVFNCADKKITLHLNIRPGLKYLLKGIQYWLAPQG